jgi:selenide,water dikinase
MQNAGFPVIKDIVLIGGGHAHVDVLRSFGMFPIKGARVTLISPEVDTPYSGMLPGLVSGHYTFEQAHIDLGPLSRFAGARFIATRVTGIDPDHRLITCADGRPPIPYDVVSVDIGSTPVLDPDLELVRQPIPVKPVSAFLAAWQPLKQRVLENPDLRIGVVGAGAGGVELLLSMQYALASAAGTAPGRGPGRFTIATRDDEILSTHNEKVRKAFRQILEKRNVDVTTGFEAKRFDEAGLSDASRTIAVDEAIWVTGAASAEWFGETGLALDDRGFIAVNDKLQSTSHATVFGAGDCVTMIADPRPKSGVFAVRQGPVLTKNLRAVVLGRPLTRYAPQKKFLSLISTGDRSAVASWGNWFQQGNWVWRWKDDIDTKFMKKFNELPAMEQVADAVMPTVVDIPDDVSRDLGPGAMRCKGCGSKIGASTLSRVLERVRADHAPGADGSPVGPIAIGPGDDAAAFEPPAGKMLVQTVDQFPAPVGDPFLAGQITANHCLGDIYAMGAKPHSALVTVMLPFAAADKQESDLDQVMAGAQQVLKAAGCPIIGGHTGEGAELTIGLTINGTVDPGVIRRKAGLEDGAVLILTKPVGSGALLAAAAAGRAKGRNVQAALNTLKQSSAEAAEILIRHGAKGLTDVTGFGLAGHLREMLAGTSLAARLRLDDIPVLQGAREAVAAGIVSSLQAANIAAAGGVDADTARRNSPAFQLLFDPQTAGGLLAGLPPGSADRALSELKAAGYARAAIVGTVESTSPTGRIRIV